jgi:hypothetical protein
MGKSKQTQELAIRSAAQKADAVGVPYILDRANASLQAEAARIFAAGEPKRLNGGAGAHFVLSGGELRGYMKDADGKLIQFGPGASVVVTL